MYSSFLLCLRRYARCFDFHVSLNFVVDNSFRHVFERDAVVRPLCPLANPLCGCFCLGSCPFCVSGLLFFFDETQIWLGDLRVVWLVCVILVCCDLPAFSDLLGPCTNVVLTAYSHVRTEPQCDIGHTRGKKSNRGCKCLFPSCYLCCRPCGFDAVTVRKLTAFSADFGGRCGIYGVYDTEPTEDAFSTTVVALHDFYRGKNHQNRSSV